MLNDKRHKLNKSSFNNWNGPGNNRPQQMFCVLRGDYEERHRQKRKLNDEYTDNTGKLINLADGNNMKRNKKRNKLNGNKYN